MPKKQSYLEAFKYKSIGYSPNAIFNSKDEKLFDKLKNNIIKSQKYKRKMKTYTVFNGAIRQLKFQEIDDEVNFDG